jgi:hypothetical protein
VLKDHDNGIYGLQQGRMSRRVNGGAGGVPAGRASSRDAAALAMLAP